MSFLYAIHNWQMIVDLAWVFFLIKQSKYNHFPSFQTLIKAMVF